MLYKHKSFIVDLTGIVNNQLRFEIGANFDAGLESSVGVDLLFSHTQLHSRDTEFRDEWRFFFL
jgi:hypothetical protein